MSPSVHSISDIFAKTASSKVAKNREESIRSVSPLAAKIERKPPLAEEERTSSPDMDAGKKTPEDLVRRHHHGQHGTNPDLMAEIKEKRASMAHKLQDEETTKTVPSGASGQPASSGLFSGVKLR